MFVCFLSPFFPPFIPSSLPPFCFLFFFVNLYLFNRYFLKVKQGCHDFEKFIRLMGIFWSLKIHLVKAVAIYQEERLKEREAHFGEKGEIKALARCVSVRDKMFSSKDGQVLILRTCEYATLFGKWDFAS